MFKMTKIWARSPVRCDYNNRDTNRDIKDGSNRHKDSDDDDSNKGGNKGGDGRNSGKDDIETMLRPKLLVKVKTCDLKLRDRTPEYPGTMDTVVHSMAYSKRIDVD